MMVEDSMDHMKEGISADWESIDKEIISKLTGDK